MEHHKTWPAGALGLAGVSLGAGIALAAWLLAGAIIDTQTPPRLVSVKGLSERVVEADLATWRLPFRGQGADRQTAIRDAIAARDAALALGAAGGLSQAEMMVEPFSLSLERTYIQIGGGRQEERLRYIASGALRMRSEDVDVIEALTGRSAELLDQGVLLGTSDYGEMPRAHYSFSGFNALKPEMIAEATMNARAAARQFAADSGSVVGRITSANQGVVQITAADGDYDERAERRKRIRVVSTVKYELE
ncbi:MAG: SIMPL domain-containing protein [Pseudomonadota bacterium]